MAEIRALKDFIERKFVDPRDDQRNADLIQVATKLQSITHKIESERWQPDDSDPFSFTATILHPNGGGSDHTIARGKLDSGCDENWISTEVLARGGFEEQVRAIEIPPTYIAFGGQAFEPKGEIDITWYAVNAGMSKKTTFLVHDQVPFDMVLGRVFIKNESVFVFKKPALALRHGRFSKGS